MRMVATAILDNLVKLSIDAVWNNILFRIIGGVCEDARIEAALDAVCTSYSDAFLVGCNELVVNEDVPLPVKVGPMHERHECVFRLTPDATGSVMPESFG